MATKTEEAPSTAPEDPLAESLARIMGKDPMSTTTGTASPISYDPEQSFRAPQADVINISGDPGTGATTSETWSHDIALENLKREQLQFEYEQSQAAIANELRAQESARAEAQLGLTKAEAARAAGLYPTQKATAEQALASAKQDAALKAAAEQRAALDSYIKYGGMTTPEQIRQAQTTNYALTSLPYSQQKAYTNALSSGGSISPSGGLTIGGGTVTADGYYVPSGTGSARYLGKPGSAVWTSNVNALSSKR